MICPKCGFEQPESPECMRCGIIVSRYKGPVAGGASPQPVAPPPLSGNETVRVTFAPPAPAAAMAAAGGTVYDSPLPAAAGAGGGTVYGGPPPSAAPARPPAFGTARSFGSGDILAQTFSVYFANFLPFALLTAIALSPLYIAQGLFVSAGQTSPGLAAFYAVLLLFGAILCPYIATGAITYGVFQQMRNQDTSIGDCLGQGLSVLFRILLLALAQGILVGLGMMACLIPGILLLVRWAVSVPAAVTERTGVSESLSRSTFLTEGYRWDVFGVLFVLGALNIGSTLLVTLVAAKNPTLSLALSGVKDLFVVGLSATGSAVMYYRLRSAKESIDVDQIASVFA